MEDRPGVRAEGVLEGVGVGSVDGGSVHDNERGQPADPVGAPPVREVDQAVGPDQEEEVVVRPFEPDRFERINAIMRTRPFRLDLRDLER